MVPSYVGGRKPSAEHPGPPWLSRTLRQPVPAWLLLEAGERKLKAHLGPRDELQPQRPISGPRAVLSVYCPALEALGTKRPFLAMAEATDVGVGRHG